MVMTLSEKKTTLEQILDNGNEHSSIIAGIRAQLQNDMTTLGNIVDKLVKKEFTVAIVGLENAGKSNLGNALIGFNIFPEKSDRCTYTTTMVCSGQKYEGEAFFYTKEGFDIWFREKLEKLAFRETENDTDHGATRISQEQQDRKKQIKKSIGEIIFKNFTKTAFEDWLKKFNITPSKQELYDEILELLNLQDDITRNFIVMASTSIINKSIVKNQQPEIVVSASKELLNLENSNHKTKLDDYITGKDKAATYAIEKIVVRSPKLAEMAATGDGNIILYDVPGFNSPANLHKAQTIEMLKKADAVVLVMDIVTNANFTDTQVNTFCNIVNNNTDDYGISIKNKCFIFANKVDTAKDISVLLQNISTLVKEVEASKVLIDNSRIFLGSASPDKDKVTAFENYITHLSQLTTALPNGILQNIKHIQTRPGQKDYGIVTLKNGITSYYSKERSTELTRKATNIIKELKNSLSNFLNDTENALSETGHEDGRYYGNATLNLFREIDEAFQTVYIDLIEDLKKNPFTSLIGNNEKIKEVFPDADKCAEHLQKVKYHANFTANSLPPLTEIDVNFRKVLAVIFLKNIAGKTVKTMWELEKKTYDKCYRKFLVMLGMPENSPKMDELVPRVETLFQTVWKENNVENGQTNSLIQRFADVLIKTIIEKPFAGNDRMANIETDFVEILSLSVYYANSQLADDQKQIDDKNNDDENPDKWRLDFLMRILFQKSVDDIANQNAAVLKEIIGSESGINLDDNLLRDLAYRLFMKCCLQLKTREDIPRKLEDDLTNIAVTLNIPDEEREHRFEEVLNNHSKKWFGEDSIEILKEMHDKCIQYNGIKKEQDIIDSLNRDIENLRKFTLEAVIPAIGLEFAFRYVILTNLDIIRYHVMYEKKIQEWVWKNLHEIDPRFNDIENIRKENDTKRQNITAIRALLEQL